MSKEELLEYDSQNLKDLSLEDMEELQKDIQEKLRELQDNLS